ncbi:MAG: 3-methyladenine DNA glycosylase [Micrococcales bacterium 73-15]|uniref:3-methyladenine DNA glycosylase n=2 Tax=Salana multivorans TaxID=120377 RepID=UPI00096794FB|nr:3-methyladenine DNA glycosylase [Salana multivorans]OJX94795.1 MAG: 3-methyladenine DNA glycosylase [Micrococcales bacterium 73-15]
MSPTLTLLPRGAWTARAEAHARRADALTAGHRERRAAGSSHAVEDFLYTYYPLRPAVLRRWSPGAGVALADAAGSPVASARWFTTEGDAVRLDGRAYLADRAGAVRHHATLLAAVADRPPVFSCFGLHEWAMVYREPAGAHRHALPLRLGEAGTDAVVERHQITCSHYDAFRFFTPEATGRNELRPTRELQVELDQPGCLHVGMDLVKVVVHLGPAVPGELALDVVELARDVRELDMRASPYDVSGFGLAPVAIETAAGKAQYVAAQRAFAARAEPLRSALLAVCRDLLASAA